MRLRLAAWYVVCAALLLGHAAWFFALRYASAPDRPIVLWTGLIALEAMIGCLVSLLATTPRDALRLSRSRSNVLILAGAVFLQVGVVIASHTPTLRSTFVALATLVMTVVLLRVLKARNQSAWIAATFAWNPIAVLVALGL